jgi:hypothetical protein
LGGAGKRDAKELLELFDTIVGHTQEIAKLREHGRDRGVVFVQRRQSRKRCSKLATTV